MSEQNARRPSIVLGRDGMGLTDESGFDAWVSFVCRHIDAQCGFEVDVDTKHPRDVQDDRITSGSIEEQDSQTVREALEALWERWCSEGAP